MKINGYSMNWEVFVEGEVSGIDEFNSNRETDSFLISGIRTTSTGKQIEWAGYWNSNDNSIELYDDGTTATADESYVMECLVEHLLEDVASRFPFNSDDSESVHAFLQALTDRLNGDEEWNGITTERLYIIEENRKCDVFQDVTTIAEEALDRLYNTDDKRIGDVSVSEVTAIKINDPSVIGKLGFDSADDLAEKYLNPYYSHMTLRRKEEFASFIKKSEIVSRVYTSSAPVKETYYYAYDASYCGNLLSTSYTTSEDRALIKKAKDTLEVARFQVENESVSELCFDASTMDIRSDGDLKRMLSHFPAIEDALREDGYDDTADELETLDARIYSEFELD